MADDMPERLLTIIRNVDRWLDAEVAGEYAAQPLGQDWARVAKTAEEVGEAIAALIAMTGQNPRKGVCGTLGDLLGELGDTAVTAIFAIQHFTKDETRTAEIVIAAMEKAGARAEKAGYA
jgi:NTP pyrophosphatase (non-canonical NTP hydrolase)